MPYLLPMALAIACVVLIQFIAHPMNDVMDLDLDRAAPIGPTGRHKPLVDGSATVCEANRLSLLIVSIVLAIILYLVLRQPVLALPAAYGMIGLFGYNHPRLRWAYRPYTELFLGAPINIVSVLVISFIGSGIITALSLSVSVVFGFAASSFFVSMMSMDYPTDLANGKLTTVVRYPAVRYCTGFPMLGLAAAVGALPALSSLGGWRGLSAVLLCIMVFVILIALGHRVDVLRLRYLEGGTDRPEPLSGDLRLGQLYASVLFSLALAIILLTGGL